MLTPTRELEGGRLVALALHPGAEEVDACPGHHLALPLRILAPPSPPHRPPSRSAAPASARPPDRLPHIKSAPSASPSRDRRHMPTRRAATYGRPYEIGVS
ncbi:MAG TPA: hypothetical protein VK420_21930, partial [Longimicrobium sp.]|nr:hypothetical protein [Longimicrobium sp.]